MGIPGFQLGWAGVSLFFCISGFLITGILLGAKEQQLPIYLKRFFIRRALRIMPVYYGYLAVAFILRRILAGNNEGALSYVFYFNNYYQAASEFKHSMLLNHLWSLAVEEQFYLVWPFVVYLLSTSRIRQVCLIMVLAAPFVRWSTVAWTGNIYWEYASLLANMDMLAMGALLATVDFKDAPRLGMEWMATLFSGVIALAALIIRIGYANLGSPQSWIGSVESHFMTTAVGLCCMLLLVSALSYSPCRIFFSFRPLVWIGKISYGIYLFHILVFTVLDYCGTAFLGIQKQIQAPYVVLVILKIASVVGLAALSHKYFENKILVLKEKLAP